jgi:hypothetical protein
MLQELLPLALPISTITEGWSKRTIEKSRKFPSPSKLLVLVVEEVGEGAEILPPQP